MYVVHTSIALSRSLSLSLYIYTYICIYTRAEPQLPSRRDHRGVQEPKGRCHNRRPRPSWPERSQRELRVVGFPALRLHVALWCMCLYRARGYDMVTPFWPMYILEHYMELWARGSRCSVYDLLSPQGSSRLRTSGAMYMICGCSNTLG